MGSETRYTIVVISAINGKRYYNNIKLCTLMQDNQVFVGMTLIRMIVQ